MNVQELATLKRYGLPVKIIVLDNRCLGMVRQQQELFYNNRESEIDLSDNPDLFHWLLRLVFRDNTLIHPAKSTPLFTTA